MITKIMITMIMITTIIITKKLITMIMITKIMMTFSTCPIFEQPGTKSTFFATFQKTTLIIGFKYMRLSSLVSNI